jgi:hypothetical protein
MALHPIDLVNRNLAYHLVYYHRPVLEQVVWVVVLDYQVLVVFGVGISLCTQHPQITFAYIYFLHVLLTNF